jgi:hypothetical protein
MEFMEYDELPIQVQAWKRDFHLYPCGEGHTPEHIVREMTLEEKNGFECIKELHSRKKHSSLSPHILLWNIPNAL